MVAVQIVLDALKQLLGYLKRNGSCVCHVISFFLCNFGVELVVQGRSNEL